MPALRTFFLVFLTLIFGYAASQRPPFIQNSCGQGTSLNIVAHQDDDLLFLNPDILHDIEGGKCVTTVYVTAGDAGRDKTYWLGRESGIKIAYSSMAWLNNSWSESDAGVPGHPLTRFTLADDDKVSLIFMHLPDGSMDGKGFSRYNYESLQKLWNGDIPNIKTVDGASLYSKDDLINTLTGLMYTLKPDVVRTQDFNGNLGEGDHGDHYNVSYFVKAANRNYKTPHTLLSYLGYRTTVREENVTGRDFEIKRDSYLKYAANDKLTCGTIDACNTSGVSKWWAREYMVNKLVTSGDPTPPLF